MRDLAFVPSSRTVTGRRIGFAVLFTVTFVSLTALMAMTLSPGGISLLDAVLLVCFMITLPWTIIGFLNAVIGLLLMRLSKNPVEKVCPIEPGDASRQISTKTALLSCIRDEDVEALRLRLSAMLAELVRHKAISPFSLFILSDTSDDDVSVLEEQMVSDLQRHWSSDIEIVYRRRPINTGFKAGNIMDFCDRWGDQYDFAITLDADSVMSADRLLDLVRKMEANPNLGILQSLAVGLPAASSFARVFQFGMRLGMRSYTLGSAWWQGDCGPYWGHNAIFRIAPFKEHCRLPHFAGTGPLSGPILSHDQVEAVLMRKAGYDIRVVPEEGGSYEENPPHLLEFIRRDLRWCQGNLQYMRLLGLPGLKLTSRIQLGLAILMFIGSPAWMVFLGCIAAISLMMPPGHWPINTSSGGILFLSIMTMVFAPKFATVIDILSSKAARDRFGGGLRVLVSAFGELFFSALVAPIMAIAHTVFMIGLLFGKSIGWGAQARDLQRLPFILCACKLWPQTLFGLVAGLWMVSQPFALIWPVLPIALGPLLAVPFAMVTSTEWLGRLAQRSGLWRTPEEQAPSPLIRDLGLIQHSGIAEDPRDPDHTGDPAPAQA